ncbi:hypothetical protein CEXT_173331 [Caerostris extrusa]|uniref:Uncharacterized protein n=1 Tax=Caerostris extrusa TaxID=172846 RepID=A0AAV4MYN9_CAEEX|nr:hypothetical protein CEXT_173331 [Caerostris extrusa]
MQMHRLENSKFQVRLVPSLKDAFSAILATVLLGILSPLANGEQAGLLLESLPADILASIAGSDPLKAATGLVENALGSDLKKEGANLADPLSVLKPLGKGMDPLKMTSSFGVPMTPQMPLIKPGKILKPVLPFKRLF